MNLRSLLVKPWTIIVYIGCIALISIAGAYHLSSQIQLLKRDIPEIVTAKRNAAAEAQYMIGVLHENLVNPTFTRTVDGAALPQRWAVEAKIRHGVEVISASSIKLQTLSKRLPSELTNEAADLLSDLSMAGQAALSSSGEARTAKAIVFHEKLDAAQKQLGSYIARFTQEQLKSSKQQKELLENTTWGATILLAVFVFFASVAGILLRLEVAAQQRRSEAEAQASFLAYHDPLTRLPNRILFSKQGSTIHAKARGCQLFLLDLDEFQAVNNSFGHAVGDSLLTTIAGRIETFFNARGGFTARLSGDEFAALLPGGISLPSIETTCEELRLTVSEPFHTEDLTLVTRTSIGAVLDNEDKRSTLGELLTRADLALREAKQLGRDTSVIYHQELAAKARYRREIRDALPVALENGEVELHFQPQIHLQSGKLSGFEVLVRWRRDGSLMPPGDFIPILEDTGIIRLLDRWVLRHATETAAEWSKTLQKPVSISVNLSPLNFQFDDIVGQVRDVLRDTQLPPHLLTLEITESVLLHNWERVARILKSLTNLGVNISLDDFGTGYSSLAYLRDLKFDELKIDRSFLADIEESHENMVILNSLVDIARGLGMNLVAEGVETLVQRDILRRIGVQTGQGFLFGTPVGEAEASGILKREAGAPVDWNRIAETSASHSSFRVA
jgi:diguanylate cyclase (GGDEF)-like protein